MSKFKAVFLKVWHETGSAEIEADSQEEADEMAEEMLASDEGISWDSGAMDPQEQCVESVTKEP